MNTVEVITVIPKYKVGQILYYKGSSFLHKEMPISTVSSFEVTKVKVTTVYRPDIERGPAWVKDVHIASYEDRRTFGAITLEEDELYETREEVENICKKENEQSLKYFFEKNLGYIISEMSGYDKKLELHYKELIKKYIKTL